MVAAFKTASFRVAWHGREWFLFWAFVVIFAANAFADRGAHDFGLEIENCPTIHPEEHILFGPSIALYLRGHITGNFHTKRAGARGAHGGDVGSMRDTCPGATVKATQWGADQGVGRGFGRLGVGGVPRGR